MLAIFYTGRFSNLTAHFFAHLHNPYNDWLSLSVV